MALSGFVAAMRGVDQYCKVLFSAALDRVGFEDPNCLKLGIFKYTHFLTWHTSSALNYSAVHVIFVS
jgi:hypothetical protein